MPAPRVFVFVDYQNLHNSAHEMWCPEEESLDKCTINPLAVARELVDKRAPGGTLTQVHVYRGRPDPRKQPTLAGATDRQALQWFKDDPERVSVHKRPLRYPPDFGHPDCVERPREKGIDVKLAVDLVTMGMNQMYDVGIVCTRDTDLLPAIEAVMNMPRVHVEVATWTGASRLSTKVNGRSLWCHFLSEEQWERLKDPRRY